MITENMNSDKKNTFKESLKFQATEKSSKHTAKTEWQETAQSWSERGRRAPVNAQIQTLEEASRQTENRI